MSRYPGGTLTRRLLRVDTCVVEDLLRKLEIVGVQACLRPRRRPLSQAASIKAWVATGLLRLITSMANTALCLGVPNIRGMPLTRHLQRPQHTEVERFSAIGFILTPNRRGDARSPDIAKSAVVPDGLTERNASARSTRTSSRWR